MIKKRLDFYEEVRIKNTVEDSNLQGKIGVVVGISEENGVIYGYAISFDDLDHGYDFSVNEITPTGRKFKREDFYDGSSISVSHDGKILPPK